MSEGVKGVSEGGRRKEGGREGGSILHGAINTVIPEINAVFY